MSWNAVERAEKRGPISAFWVWFKVFAVIVVTVSVFGGGWFVITRPFAIALDTFSSENVKQNYEWFKQRHEDILALDTKIKQSRAATEQFSTVLGPRANWHREDREESARLNTIVLGLRHQRADLAAEFNAHSRMVNRVIFKGTDTPSRIETE